MRIVALGGTTRPGSQSEVALRQAATEAERLGAAVVMLTGADLDLPMYDPGRDARSDVARRLVEALREADGVIVSSPGYHGSFSGLVKNALDYAEDLREDPRPYLDGRAVGLIACAAGVQAAAGTLSGLRGVAHALRGWPTPLGVAVTRLDEAAERQIALMTGPVVAFARMMEAVR